MIQVAFVKPSGEIDYITSPGSDGLITNREYYDGNLAVHISYDEDPIQFVKTNVWDFEREEWTTRPNRPSDFHVWENGRWNFQSEPFWEAMRRRRNFLLQESDWTQLADTQISEPELQQWRLYRQQLRDIPAANPNATVLDGINWPEKPTTPRN